MWLKIIQFAAPIIAIAGLALWLNNIAYDHGTAAANLVCSQTTVPTAVAAEKLKGDTALKQSQETCNAYETQRNTANANYDRLWAEHSAVAGCSVTTASSPASRVNGQAKAAVPSVRVGATIGWFDTAFHDADTESGKLLVCQGVLASIYTAAGEQDRLSIAPTQASPED